MKSTLKQSGSRSRGKLPLDAPQLLRHHLSHSIGRILRRHAPPGSPAARRSLLSVLYHVPHQLGQVPHRGLRPAVACSRDVRAALGAGVISRSV
jgi:hypothetical protein